MSVWTLRSRSYDSGIPRNQQLCDKVGSQKSIEKRGAWGQIRPNSTTNRSGAIGRNRRSVPPHFRAATLSFMALLFRSQPHHRPQVLR